MYLNQSGNKYYPKIILGQNIPLRVQPWEMWKVATSGSMHMRYGKKFWTLQAGGVERQGEHQGHLEAKVRKQRAGPSSVSGLGFFFFPSTCGSWCQEQNLKSQNFIEFSFGIQKNLFDFSSPSLFFLSHVFPLRIFISTHMPQRGSSYHLEKYAFLTFWKGL